MNNIRPGLRLDNIDAWCVDHFGNDGWQPYDTQGFTFFNQNLISMFLMEWGPIIKNEL